MPVAKWLSRQDFEKLDELFGKLGYGGYYDFLQCLKDIASRSGAIYCGKGNDVQAWDLEDFKTIPEVVSILMAWSNKLSSFLHENPQFIEKILAS